MTQNRVIRVGMFIDGRFFEHTSNYYRRRHPIAHAITPSGFVRFVEHELRQILHEDAEVSFLEKHFYIGIRRQEKAHLMARLQDSDIEPHTFPLSIKEDRTMKEMGVDVALATDACVAAATNELDVVVLVAGDGDLFPAIKKIRKLGKPVFLVHLYDPTSEEAPNIVNELLIINADYVIYFGKEIHGGNQYALGAFEPREGSRSSERGPHSTTSQSKRLRRSS